MTRRELAAFLAVAPAVAQTAVAPDPPQPSDPLAAAKDDLNRAAAQLAKPKLEMTTEPAFRFKA
jgi:hypothetical protein